MLKFADDYARNSSSGKKSLHQKSLSRAPIIQFCAGLVCQE